MTWRFTEECITTKRINHPPSDMDANDSSSRILFF